MEPQTIKELRLNKGWSQAEFAKKFKKTKHKETISRWENGVAVPSTVSLIEISTIFGISISDILIDLSIKKDRAEG